jgi:hypothetical protein
MTMTSTPKELLAAATWIAQDNLNSQPAKMLAAHILATVRADDEDPVTGPRLIVLDFWYRTDGGGVLYSPCNRLRVWVGPIERWSVDSERIPEPLWPKTMGEFRRLCRVLGITLPEVQI